MDCTAAILFGLFSTHQQSPSFKTVLITHVHHELQRKSGQDLCQQKRQTPCELFVFLGKPTDCDRVSQCLRTIHSHEYRRCHDSDVRLEDKLESVPFVRVCAVRPRSSQQSTIHQCCSSSGRHSARSQTTLQLCKDRQIGSEQQLRYHVSCNEFR